MSDETPRFTIVVDGVTVEGEIASRWPRDIAVRLLSPIGHLCSSCSVPLFAAQHVDYTGPQGDEKARELLGYLYRKARLFDRHRDELRRRLREFEEKLAAFERDDRDRPAALREAKLALRRRFRAGEFDQRAWQRELRALRDLARAYEDRRDAIVRAFMDNPPWPDRMDLGQISTFLEESSMPG